MAKGTPGFFDVDERLAELSAKGDDLERMKSLVDFELFRKALGAAIPRAERSKGGRRPFDHLLMFKILILQAMHSLSDARCEYLIKDRLSFMRFLGGIRSYLWQTAQVSCADAHRGDGAAWTSQTCG